MGVDERELEGPLERQIRPLESRAPDLSELAKSYADTAFSTLVDVAMNGSSDTARIAAANSILDRGYGKPRADLEEVVDLPPVVIQRAE
jgi:hypothetical protein